MQQLYGNTTGLKQQDAQALRALYNRRVPSEKFVSPQLSRALVEVTQQIRRRIGLLIDRGGRVDKVIVGNATRVFLPDLGARRAGTRRFRGVRLVLSTLRPHGLSEDELTDLALLQLDAVITIFAQPDGLPGKVQYAHLLPPDSNDLPWRIEDIPSVHNWDDDWHAFIADLETQFARSPRLQEVEGREAAILVGITLSDPRLARRSLMELGRLADTAGLKTVDSALQKRAKLDGKTCIGKGKLQDLIVRSMHLGVEVLVFDRELT
ncbi:MAG: GTPase HflX, partial [Proteobacteria bacterium]|nr:GTPase HflX [Pseudomonadota bacterium]